MDTVQQLATLICWGGGVVRYEVRHDTLRYTNFTKCKFIVTLDEGKPHVQIK